MQDSEFLARAAEIINQTADMLKADNDSCDHAKFGVVMTANGYCTSCNRKANAERVNEIIRLRKN